MTMHATLEISFLSDWHLASGLGDGTRADSALIRDWDGLPCIPGSALKGALREGAHRMAGCRDDLRHAETYFWGTRNDAVESNVPGHLHVYPGRMPSSVHEALEMTDKRDREALIRDMTVIRSHTALDERGNVIEHSLRSIECGIAGLTFEAALDVDADNKVSDSWLSAYLACVCAAARGIGADRSRGLGLCRIHIIGTSGPLKLPEPNAFFLGKESR